MKLFCKHEKYEVITWRYQNFNKPNQRIIATVNCLCCGKENIEKIITDQSTMDVFAFVHEDKHAAR